MDEKNVVVLGGTRGFGLELAREFASLGARLAITGRNLADAQAAAEKITKTADSPGPIYTFQVDIRSPDSLERLQRDIAGKIGSIDLFVVNAGVNQFPDKAWNSSPADIEQVITTNLCGAMYAVRAFMPAMVAAGHGSIWFIEGLGSNGMVVDKHSLYGSSKRALAYYWRALAREAKGTGVAICALSPGMMITDFLMGGLDRQTPAERARTMRIFNILADRPQTVARFAAPKMLAGSRNGRLVQWLTVPKTMLRFLRSPFSERSITTINSDLRNQPGR